jgi:hypothetical protein
MGRGEEENRYMQLVWVLLSMTSVQGHQKVNELSQFLRS